MCKSSPNCFRRRYQPILLGNMEIIIELKKELGFEAEVEIIDTKN
jgi:hypothetical protein